MARVRALTLGLAGRALKKGVWAFGLRPGAIPSSVVFGLEVEWADFLWASGIHAHALDP